MVKYIINYLCLVLLLNQSIDNLIKDNLDAATTNHLFKKHKHFKVGL